MEEPTQEQLEEAEKVENAGELDNIPLVEPKQQFDAAVYEGKRVKIARVEKKIVDTHYVTNDQGEKVYDVTKTEQQDIIEIETEILNPEDETFPVTVNARFNLQKDENGNVIISKHPKANLYKFLRKMGCEKPSELKGKIVTITTQPDRDNPEKLWLRIVQ